MADRFADVPKELMSQYKDAFKIFDSNGDGVIDKAEFAEVTKSIGMDQSDESIQIMIDTIGSDNKVTYNQFIGVMSGKMKNMDTEEDVMEAFKAFDQDKSGFVDAKELDTALSIFCPQLSEDERKALINEAGGSGGKIKYNDFVRKLFDMS
jgi:calmodulin